MDEVERGVTKTARLDTSRAAFPVPRLTVPRLAAPCNARLGLARPRIAATDQNFTAGKGQV